VERRTFIAASAVAAALATDACAKSASALEMVETKAEFDYPAFVRLVNRPFDIRQLWDVNGYVPTALGAMKNAYNGYQFGYGIPAASIGIAACLHGTATAFAYRDSIWAKYKLGEAFNFKDPGGNVVSTNIFYHARATDRALADPNDPLSLYQDGTLEALQRRGLIVLVCHTALAEQARSLVNGGAAPAGTSPADVLRDLLANLVPGATVVPTMVATVGILQSRFKYAYTTE
jgi:intracellular sulfur oxidation DsrE/DsrF family protein